MKTVRMIFICIGSVSLSLIYVGLFRWLWLKPEPSVFVLSGLSMFFSTLVLGSIMLAVRIDD